jgi:hypothetical protein
VEPVQCLVRRRASTNSGAIFRRVRKIAKSDYLRNRVCLSVRPHGTTRLLLDAFLLDLIFGYFSKSHKSNGYFT